MHVYNVLYALSPYSGWLQILGLRWFPFARPDPDNFSLYYNLNSFFQQKIFIVPVTACVPFIAASMEKNENGCGGGRGILLERVYVYVSLCHVFAMFISPSSLDGLYGLMGN